MDKAFDDFSAERNQIKILEYLERIIDKEKTKMTKGKLEKTIVDPYLPSKIVPPEYIRDVLNEANNDFPSIEFEYELPHKWLDEEYKNRYEELERQMMEVLNWRSRWFGKPDTNK